MRKKKVKETLHLASDSVETRQKLHPYSEFPQPVPQKAPPGGGINST